MVVRGIGQIDYELLLHRDAALQRRDRGVESVDDQSVLTFGNRRCHGQQVVRFGLDEAQHHRSGLRVQAPGIIHSGDFQREGSLTSGNVGRNVHFEHTAVGARCSPCDADTAAAVIHVGHLPLRPLGAGLHLHAERAARPGSSVLDGPDLVVHHQHLYLVLGRKLHYVDHGRQRTTRAHGAAGSLDGQTRLA